MRRSPLVLSLLLTPTFKTFKARLSLSLLLVTALSLAGCDRHDPVSPVSDSESPVVSSVRASERSAELRGVAAESVEGRIGPGALYSLHRPDNWNGDLILYAHGYTPPQAPISLPDISELRDQLLGLGYGVALSSYSENGYALKDGAQRTQQLRGLFVSRFGVPHRTFLFGVSLGGIVALKLAEQHPQHYAGALLVCAVAGGTAMEVDYISHVRVLFDYFYPGVLPGSLLELPPGTIFQPDVVDAIVQAIVDNPQGAGAMAQVTQGPLPFADATELVNSIVQALGFQFVGLNDFLERTHGRSFFDNSDVVYTGNLPPPLLQDINARVARYESTPDAQNFLRHYYQPSGDLKIPLLTLHTSRDPIVPTIHETFYGNLVTAAGHSDLLLQREVQRYGHCAYATSELVVAFQDLVGWAETGVKPAQ